MKLLVAGDFRIKNLGHSLVIDPKLLRLFHSSELNLINLEAPITDFECKNKKRGLSLKADRHETLKVLHDLKIGCVNLANNHIGDYGARGVLDTISCLSLNGFRTVGAGKDLDESRRPFFFEKDGLKLAIINIAEAEFSASGEGLSGANQFNPIDLFYQILEVRKTVDKVIVVFHGGHEHYPFPSPEMKRVLRFIVDCGADGVIAHHTHCFSGIENYKGAPIVYGTGNFYFESDNSEPITFYEGYVVELDIDFDKVILSVHPIFVERLNSSNSILRCLSDDEQGIFDSRIAILNEVIQDDKSLLLNFRRHVDQSNRSYLVNFEPYNSRIFMHLYFLKLVPKYMTARKKKQILALIQNGFHKEALLIVFQAIK
jgi:hypothetical protein